jgi:Fe-only nitrogenase accessory protein AnfO
MKENANVMAVFCDDTDQITRFDTMTSLVFYTKKDSAWNQSGKIPVKPDLTGGMAAIRENVTRIITAFNDCRIIITQSLTGIPYQIFDQAGFIICESEDFGQDLLDAIQTDLIRLAKETETVAPPVSKAPVAADDSGHFFLDLNQVQMHYPDLSSKMALLPFLRDTPFYALEVVCNHIPPWFENIFPELGLAYTVQTEDAAGKHVVITHVVCGE